LYFNKSFFVDATLFVGFVIVHILLVESPNKRENVLFFCCILGPLTIYFAIKVKESPKKRSCFFFFFFKNNLIFFLCFFFFFFSKQIYLWGPYSIEKKPFQLKNKVF
jgi:4-hydroxybenzoate polyprenyltransferase